MHRDIAPHWPDPQLLFSAFPVPRRFQSGRDLPARVHFLPSLGAEAVRMGCYSISPYKSAYSERGYGCRAWA
jgi:hypothetical protein